METPTKLGRGTAVEELEGLALGDARLDARVRHLVTALERNPAAGFPAAVHTEAAREATYRLLGNARVSLDKLLAPHVRQTVARAAHSGLRPLAVIDKTEFVFAGESARAGLTRLGPARHGFDAFVGLAVTPTRRVLGVVGVRPLPGHAGASSATSWTRMIDTVEAQLGPLAPIYVMDREADAYAVVAHLMAGQRDFVIRISPDRRGQASLAGPPEVLRAVVTRTPLRLERLVPLARRTGVGRPRESQRHHPPREGRPAQLVIRACAAVLPRPKKLGAPVPATLPVHVVHVQEVAAPAGQPAVEWLLVTSLPIDTPAAVAAVVDHYRARWTIEEYFKALKSGCAYEKRQLESRPALLNALGLLAPLAWRLLALRTLADDPDAPATTVLAPDELHVLRAVTRDATLGRAPTAAQALLAVARLGGHFAQNGRPGWKVLWIGFHKLLDRVDGYRLAQAEQATM